MQRRFGARAYMNLSAAAQSSPQEPLDVWARACKLKPETVEALRPFLNPDQESSLPFMSLLGRLGGCASFKTSHRAGSVRELGNILQLAAGNDAYRALCFDLAGGADANCHDNVDVIFGNLRLAAKDPTYRGAADLDQVLKYHKSCVPWSLIDDFVSTRFPSFDESLERVLALRIRLSDLLPIKTPAMRFSGIAGVDRAIERQARAYIAAHRDTEACLQRSLARSPAWRQFLEQRYPVEFVANTLLWESALQDVIGKPQDDGSARGTPPSVDTESPGSRTEMLARARAMPGIGTGHAFQRLQGNATLLLMEDMTRRLVVGKQPPSTEAEAYAHLLNDPDWLAYLETAHPEDPALSSDSMGTQDRRERLMLLTRQEITAARGG
ncbi:type III effector protein (plasmid) [Ralstonia solanacearum]|nr:NEL-type E3 ubiquitin ligase domain-containing protein [Ralstonia solanacearum]AXV89156.1 type III effector protein [Ralstonia solanacearum]AXW08962.1 type III effector protein [Ralstonia solanacearum]AXW26754.1 type III effector protein [Ralstonia solanacearum]AXW83664.1 type III effector protein [Ralstonia solanacearum]